MSTTYEWLFESYAIPRLKELEESRDALTEALVKRVKLTEREQIDVWDTLSVMRYQWGAEAFALGMQLGVRLTAPGQTLPPLAD